MYSYRLKGILSVLAGIQLLVLGGVFCLVGMAGAPLSEGASALHLWMPWGLGVAWEAAWRAASGGRVPRGAASALQRCVLASFVPALIWGAWGGLLGSALWLVALWGGACGLLFLLHWTLPPVVLKAFFSGHHLQRALLVGAPQEASKIQSVLQNRENLGIVPVGWLCSPEDEGNHRGSLEGLPRWGRPAQLEEVIRRESVQQVILAGHPSDPGSTEQLAATCERLGIRLTLARMLHFGISREVSWETEGQWCVASFYQEPLQSPLNRCAKRLLDLAVSLPVLLLAMLPLLLISKLAQMTQSPGPLFCKQWRHGRDNRSFQIWKLRTMHPNPTDLAKQATRTDSRVYPFGRFLRRHSLDELPQFLNVLTGDMSIVGPRPHLREHTEGFAEQRSYRIRAFVKPGITGLAQINGCRGEVHSPDDIRRRVDWDIRYVENWSLLLDLKIMLQTVREVLFPSSSAY